MQSPPPGGFRICRSRRGYASSAHCTGRLGPALIARCWPKKSLACQSRSERNAPITITSRSAGVTWSIIVRERHSGKLGIAVATKFFAVGALVPYIAARVGAVATQALVNPYLGVNGIALLRVGHSAAETLNALIVGDEGRDHRQ